MPYRTNYYYPSILLNILKNKQEYLSMVWRFQRLFIGPPDTLTTLICSASFWLSDCIKPQRLQYTFISSCLSVEKTENENHNLLHNSPLIYRQSQSLRQPPKKPQIKESTYRESLDILPYSWCLLESWYSLGLYASLGYLKVVCHTYYAEHLCRIGVSSLASLS